MRSAEEILRERVAKASGLEVGSDIPDDKWKIFINEFPFMLGAMKEYTKDVVYNDRMVIVKKLRNKVHEDVDLLELVGTMEIKGN